MSVNTPNSIPAFTALTFNLNGAVCDPARKLKWIFNEFVKPGAAHKADILLFQELHFVSITDVRKAFWPYRGELKGLSLNPLGKTRGVIAWVPADSALAGLVETVSTDTVEGRWALMKINSKAESLHILNMYAPSKSVAARESFFESLGDRFSNYSNLIVAGDWNFRNSDSVEMEPESRYVGPVEMEPESRYVDSVEMEPESRYVGSVEMEPESRYVDSVEMEPESRYVDSVKMEPESRNSGRASPSAPASPSPAEDTPVTVSKAIGRRRKGKEQ